MDYSSKHLHDAQRKKGSKCSNRTGFLRIPPQNLTQSQNTQQKPPKTEVLRGRKILFEIVRSETYDYRLENWERLILLDS